MSSLSRRSRPEVLREVESVLSRAYGDRDRLIALLQRIGMTEADYPARAASVRIAWTILVQDLHRSDRLSILLEEARRDAAVARHHEELSRLLPRILVGGVEAPRPPVTPSAAHRLLADTVFRGLGEAASGSVQSIVDGLVVQHDATADSLFIAARFAIEYQLLCAPDLTSETLLEVIGNDERFRILLAAVLQNDVRFRLRLHSQEFFMRTRARESQWAHYFEAVWRAMPEVPKSDLETLCRVRVPGFVAPQFLVAGLLSRFDDDWGRIVAVYDAQTTRQRSRFAHLQASQWNTWLMWGPSVPICTCDQWYGVQAYQLGFGDETNSIPVLGTGPATLDGTTLFRATPHGEPRKVTSRLRWAPWVLREHGMPQDSYEDMREVLPKKDAARAQRSVYRVPTGGLMLQAEGTLDPVHTEAHWYYSAYQWLMFLVAVRTSSGSVARLEGRFPAPSAYPVERRSKRLWRQLLPVFVHANVADALALQIQRNALVESAIGLLRQVWAERAELVPDAPDSLVFWLVGGSDYSGCGEGVAFAPHDLLADRLRQRLAEDDDSSFARSVVIPDTTTDGPTIPNELTRFYSTCHLPELINDYYEYIDELKKRR